MNKKIGWIGKRTWSYNIGDRVRVHNHFDHNCGVKYGNIIGQDQMGDQYFDVKLENPNRAGEFITVCEDKEDLSLVH